MSTPDALSNTQPNILFFLPDYPRPDWRGVNATMPPRSFLQPAVGEIAVVNRLNVLADGGGVGNTPDAWGNDYFSDRYFVNGELRQFDGYCTDVFFREGMAFIEEHKDEPFFCYIATNAPHGPFHVEKRYSDLYRDVAPSHARACFYGMVTNIDENVGALRAHLDRLGLRDNTIVIFMTDNGSGGGVAGDADGHVTEGPANFNAGMRGWKGSPYEGGHRVPFLIYHPARKIGGGKDICHLVSYTDFMPTLLELCGVDVPAGRTFDGQSLVPLLEGNTAGNWNERMLVADTQRIARPAKWRLSCVMRARWRLVNGTELYDLKTDYGERNDIARAHPDIIAQLRAGYDQWWDAVRAQFDRDIPFALGTSAETVCLTTHDIRNEAMDAAWHQVHVRRGTVVSGYWEVDVRQAGCYEIELRRWPRESGVGVARGIDGDDVPWRRDVIGDTRAEYHSGGRALDLRWAQISIAGRNHQKEIQPDDPGVLFTVTLPKGPTRLCPCLYGSKEQTMAPYYIYIRLLV